MQGTTPRRRATHSVLAAVLVLVTALLLAACGDDDSSGGGTGDGGSASSGPVTITMWHGQGTGPSADKLVELVREFNSTHPDIKVDVTPGATGNETILEKVTAALAGGDPPNIAYSYGSNVASISRSPQVVDLTDTVQEEGWDWEGFYGPYRDSVTIDGRVIAIPGPGDSLAIIYNKALFRRAGIPEPQEGWTWDDYREIAKQLTDKGAGVYGAAFQSGGGLDSTWPFWPMVWQRGGEVLSEDGTTVGWDDGSALGGLEFLRGLAQDGSVYADTSPGYPKMHNLFNNGRVGMYEGDPWQLPTIKEARIDYGVAPLPGVDGEDTTIVGPDAWFVFDGGDDENAAAAEFLKWFTEPTQDARWNGASGNLPSRVASADEQPWLDYVRTTPGLEVFTNGLETGKAVPRFAQYAEMSDALGQAIQEGVVKTDGDLEAAVKAAADKSNSLLATSP
jgi:multiple sugar transport system substrate-binding protein